MRRKSFDAASAHITVVTVPSSSKKSFTMKQSHTLPVCTRHGVFLYVVCQRATRLPLRAALTTVCSEVRQRKTD